MVQYCLVASVLFAVCAAASPVSDVKRAVASTSPPIEYPRANSAWKVYGHHNVTWDATGVPASVATTGKIQLRKAGQTVKTLVTDVDLRAGRQEIVIPSYLMAGTDYSIYLYANSSATTSAQASKSPEFIISGASGEFWGYPPVTYPRAGTVWKLGSRHNVSWTTDSAPAVISNYGAIYLRRNLTSNYRRVSDDFDLSTGRHEIEIPTAIPTGKYRVTLLGYDDNFGEEFTVTK